MKRLLVALALAGCSAQTTTLDVTVAGSFPVDQLRLYAALSYGPVAQVAPAMAAPLTLPYAFTAYLPDRDDTAQVAVEAQNGGVIVGSGLSAPFAVTMHHATALSISLDARCAGSPCTGTELFCDGFEGGLGAWSSTVGMPTIDTATKCDGASALSLGGTQPAYVTKAGLTMPTTIYARAHLYVTGAASTPPFTILALGGDDALTLGYDAGQAAFVTSYAGKTSVFGGPLEHDVWLCVKMEARLDPSNGLLAVSVDDNEYDRFDALALGTPSQYSTFEAGSITPTSTAIDYFLDDVAIADHALPCD